MHLVAPPSSRWSPLSACHSTPLGPNRNNDALYLDPIECMCTEGEARASELQGPEPKAERTHADRVAAVDYLASIVGEVLQPIAAMVADAQAALHWLDHPAPDVDEAREALSCIIMAGAWAG